VLSVTVLPRLRAPQQDGAVLAEPPLADVGRLLAVNQARLADLPFDLLGRPASDLRLQARQAALAAAQEYLREADGLDPRSSILDPRSSILMAGHQPELFHPGVWVKHFALHGLAARHGATPLNLLVDNDTVKTTSLRVPVPGDDGSWPRLANIPFDQGIEEVPYEERTVHDETLFADFAERVPRWDYVPLLDEFWAAVRRQAGRTRLLGERLAAARRTCERRWGCHNLELPVSRLCRTEPFAWFAGHLLAELPRFHAVYNSGVRDYRRRHGIRSRHHPVPDLAAEGDWLEAPFWAWRPGQARRGRLMARRTKDQIELRIGADRWPGLPLTTHHSPLTTHPLVAAWQDLERQGLKVRSRALTNTMYARLFLADLFVHGIGGGKYDELTDEILRRFWGFEPPGFLVLSATLLLPLPAYPAREEERRQLAHQLRDLVWNPQRHLGDGPASDAAWMDLAAHKRAWIERQPEGRAERRERFRALRELNEQMHHHLDGRPEELRRRLARCEQELAANAILRRRDYAFCLYPEAPLRRFCTQFL
jgi:hypothetical protein